MREDVEVMTGLEITRTGWMLLCDAWILSYLPGWYSGTGIY